VGRAVWGLSGGHLGKSAGELLKVSPLKKSVPEEAEQLEDEAFALMPHLKITELLLEADQWLAVPYEDREAAKAAGAKWDWREKLWYIGPDGTRKALAKWLPENASGRQRDQADPREEFAAVLRELGGDLTGEHPIMDGRPHRMATLDDDRGEKSMFYIAHSDGRPAGYAKNNRTGEEQR
jgi:putative DNA primase/helicase